MSRYKLRYKFLQNRKKNFVKIESPDKKENNCLNGNQLNRKNIIYYYFKT